MSLKAARGTKRVCGNCGSKFYDLNREEIICPICNTVFQHQDAGARATLSGNATDDDDDDLIVSPPSNVEIVSLDEADSNDSDLPNLEGEDIVEIDDDDADLGDDDEPFIEVDDDDSGDDVTGIVGGSRDEDEEV
ncbi:MAG: TIGR02300 family protein [Hyphomicrobiales bacterium]|nr:TIGR02300 family protein [Hyphomicrobiales bacterium]